MNRRYNPVSFWTTIPYDALEYLLSDSGGLRWGDVNAPYNGSTKLHWAAKHTKDARVIKVLLDAGADRTATDSDGRTPLEAAMYAGNVKAIRMLDI